MRNIFGGELNESFIFRHVKAGNDFMKKDRNGG